MNNRKNQALLPDSVRKAAIKLQRFSQQQPTSTRMYVRKVQGKNGTVLVQIEFKCGRRRLHIKHIGTAHNNTELESLCDYTRKLIQQINQQVTLAVQPVEYPPKLKAIWTDFQAEHSRCKIEYRFTKSCGGLELYSYSLGAVLIAQKRSGFLTNDMSNADAALSFGDLKDFMAADIPDNLHWFDWWRAPLYPHDVQASYRNWLVGIGCNLEDVQQYSRYETSVV